MNEHNQLRQLWTFHYPVREVAEAAKMQRDFRRGRQAWWTDKKAEIMEAIKRDGVEITESVADQLQKMSSYSTRSFGPQVSIKEEYVQQLAECHTKIDTHRKAAAEYDGWVQVLEKAPVNMSMECTHADWLYFFGKL